MEWEKVFGSDLTDKGLVSKTGKDFIKLNTQKPNTPVKKRVKGINRHFSKEDNQMARKHVRKC